MYKQYFSQTICILKENKLLSAISIIGTSLAICMIMVIVLVYQVRTANYKPENNRDRILSVESADMINRQHPDWNYCSMLSLKLVKECLYPLKSAEAVTAIIPNQNELLTAPGIASEIECQLSYTDYSFWKVFNFTFLRGKPFTKEEFQSGIKKVVVSASVAKQLYETIDVVGKSIELGFVDYIICGVVEDVSYFAETSYADAWAPYTSTPKHLSTFGDTGLLGDFRCHILARSSSDFDAIRKEVDKNVQQINLTQKEDMLTLHGQPCTQLELMAKASFNESPKLNEMIIKYILIVFIILLVPAINLSGMTLSRMRKRMSEIGVRKAFGATRGELLIQILSENFLLTLLGGILGLLFAYLSICGMKSWFLDSVSSDLSSTATQLHFDMLFQPMVFVCAFLFCLLLNLLSAGIPAWRVSKTTIIKALNEK